MASTDKGFYDRFPSFTGLANDFSDPSDDAMDDASIARAVRKELAPEERIKVLSRLLSDSERMLADLEADWRQLASYVNRHFADAGAARTWLLEMCSAWAEERDRLER
jgi:hypothetical protein